MEDFFPGEEYDEMCPATFNLGGLNPKFLEIRARFHYLLKDLHMIRTKAAERAAERTAEKAAGTAAGRAAERPVQVWGIQNFAGYLPVDAQINHIGMSPTLTLISDLIPFPLP